MYLLILCLQLSYVEDIIITCIFIYEETGTHES